MKICPLSIIMGTNTKPCLRETCAWWNQSPEGGCRFLKAFEGIEERLEGIENAVKKVGVTNPLGRMCLE